MKSSAVLLDAGPLVAIVQERESHHAECVETADQLTGPILTCWPVITEAAWLTRKLSGGQNAVLTVVEEFCDAILDISIAELGALRRIGDRYQSLRPQLADIALVYLAEREGIDTVFTLDRRDFSVYRTSTGKALKMIP